MENNENVVSVEESKSVVTSKIRNKCIRRWIFRQRISQNLERFYALGFLYSMIPALTKIYENNPEELKASMHRHLEAPYITNPGYGACINGAVIVMEEERARGADIPDQMINGFKTGMMGPMAGFGDSVYVTTMPLLLSFFMPFAQKGMMSGVLGQPIFWLHLIIMGFVTYYMGYNLGRNSIMNILKNGTIQAFITGASVLGMFMLGALCAQNVSLKLASETAQGMLDNMMPGLLPALVTLGCYLYMKKGGKYLYLLAFIIVGCLLGALIGLF